MTIPKKLTVSSHTATLGRSHVRAWQSSCSIQVSLCFEQLAIQNGRTGGATDRIV
jgi:hypothetical protein